ncbi:alpha-amylase family glycosyl hydrolase [Blautia schinkii]|uniref:alpha-amylase family glycosyl hydrolase n=1 Tax=Blautia schinkii TaxID=180164 RepID=UPI00156D66DF|nr:alpha-amylase family glycosyl hydrolase [Blautia schinkii]NSK33960.1 alpha-amylase [Blautia schinkii]NSK64604.1 alpha-amylase [Blautia schinkii]
MSWYNEAIFYHIYPLGLTGAPKENDYGTPVHRLNTLLPWIDHIREIGCTALYIGPLFESVGHGYETTDYKKLDSRLGTNEDLTNFVKACHDKGIRVIFDGVFNHTGRDFFAFRDIQKNREHSPYVNWYCNVNFGGNTEYNDGFSYENWGGYNLLVKLNQRNPEVQNYICDVIRFWVSEFDIDGIRLDAADVLDFDFMRILRHTADEVKKDFWLMGEVIHGDYSRWVNGQTLHSVTNYVLHKALYSGHNDHNYFEIAHTVKYLQNMGDLDLYNFVDNHDVERIYTKLQNKAHFAPVHVLLYTLPGVPSIYYGSEFGIDGKKEKFSDASLRPALNLDDYADSTTKNPCTALIAALGKVRQGTPALSYGSYAELALTNRQFAFARDLDGMRVIVTVNNDDSDAEMNLPTGSAPEYVGALTGQKVSAQGGRIRVRVAANSGEIWLPAGDMPEYKPVRTEIPEMAAAKEEITVPEAEENQTAENGTVTEAVPEKEASIAENTDKASDNTANSADVPSTPEAESSNPQETKAVTAPNPHKTPEEMTVGELQAAILAKMAGNGPVDDQMKKTVYDNIWHDSLVNWLKSFR